MNETNFKEKSLQDWISEAKGCFESNLSQVVISPLTDPFLPICPEEENK